MQEICLFTQECMMNVLSFWAALGISLPECIACPIKAFIWLCLHACHFFILSLPSEVNHNVVQATAKHLLRNRSALLLKLIWDSLSHLGISSPQGTFLYRYIKVSLRIMDAFSILLKWIRSGWVGGWESLMGAKLHLASGFFSHEVHRQYTITFREKFIFIDWLTLQVWEKRGGGKVGERRSHSSYMAGSF